MKRKALCLFAALALITALLCLPAFAEDGEEFYVYDEPDLLTLEEWQRLETRAEALTERYGCGVYITVFNDMSEFGYNDVEDFAEAVYREWELGVGEERNCIVLVLSMAERDYDLMAHGELGHSAFTDYGKQALANEFLDDFRGNDWASGFEDYLGGCEQLLQLNENGTPFDVPDYEDGGSYEPREPLSVEQRLTRGGIPGVIVGLFSGLIYSSGQKRKMKSAVAARDADEYLARRGVHMDVQDDVFTHTTVVRQHIERDSGSRGSHGGTSVNSGGFSHSSGKF